MEVRLMNVETEEELLTRIDRMGHISYSDKYENRDIDTCKRFLTKIVKNKHHSVLEHIVFYFEIEGISSVCSHQLVRRILASPTQQPMRFTKLTDRNNYYTPSAYTENDKALKIYNEILEKSMETCNKLLELGIKKEDACYVLPQAYGSAISFTISLRSFLNLMRSHRAAQEEIRKLAIAMLEQVYLKYPSIHNTIIDYIYGVL